MNDNTNLTDSDSSRDAELSAYDQALTRVISLTLHPEALEELTSLMDDGADAMVAAAFVLYVKNVTLVGSSLSHQFKSRLVLTYGEWDDAITEADHVARWRELLQRIADEHGTSIDDVLTWNEKAILSHLPALGIQAIKTDEGTALFSLPSDR